MSKQPERILTTGTMTSGSWNAETASTKRIKLAETEYVRADLIQQACAEAYAEALEAAVIAIEGEALRCPASDSYDTGYSYAVTDCRDVVRALPSPYEVKNDRE